MPLDRTWPLQATISAAHCCCLCLPVSCPSPLSICTCGVQSSQAASGQMKTLRPIQGKWQIPDLRVCAKQAFSFTGC